MNSPIRKIGKKLRRGVSDILSWFPRELYTSYVVPALFLLCAGTFIVVMEWIYAASGNGFTEGRPSPRTYRAHTPMTYIDLEVTDRLRERAGDSVAGVIVRNIGAAERMKLRLDEFRDIESGGAPVGVLAEDFPEELLKAFGVLSEDQRVNLLFLAAQVGEVYFETVASGDSVAEERDRVLLWTEINKIDASPAERNLIYQLLEEVAEPRYRTDPNLTEFLKNESKKNIPVVERKMEVGDIIVRYGDAVTPSIARSLREQGYPEDKFPLAQWSIACFLVLILPLWIDIVTHDAKGAVRGLGDGVWNCAVLAVSAGWICEAAAVYMGIEGGGILASVVVAFLCMPRRLAFNVSLMGTASGVFLTAGLSPYGVLSLLIVTFSAATIGFYALMKVDSFKNLRTKVFFIAVALAFVNEAVRVLLGFSVIESLAVWPVGETWRRIGYFLLFDLVTSSLAVFLLVTIEGYIGAFSVLRARELSHPSSPLLRKLQAEAPGTYHHSLMIGALAEPVANELGLDENLIRVGAYYHDIGKIRRPRHFVENQMGGDNIHDELSPTLSAVAIIAHVREGAELANEFGLPKKVKQFITEHHGTTCVSYFYKKALALGENVEREQFCYPGPRPQSRETALLMIMDSLEAAVRSESKNISTVLDIKEIIERVVNIKISEKQLYDADFTFKELELLKEASFKALQSMYHTRTVKEIKDKKEEKGINEIKIKEIKEIKVKKN